MSTLRVNNLQNTSTTDGGISIDTSGHVTVDSVAMPSSGPLSNRNKIINGDMRIAQRGTGAVTISNDFPVDRFAVQNSTNGAFSAQQDSSAPAGFTSSVKVTITTADASLTTTQSLAFRQFIEGSNVYDFSWGSADAQTVTLSFWVRSSLTGTFSGSIVNNAADRSFPFTYTISTANTWEQKTVTITGDTTGTWLTNTGIGLRIYFSLGSGPDVVGTPNQWNAALDFGATGETALVGTLNATWYITGVQLEAGTVATPFERRSYGQELSLCQRYYQSWSIQNYQAGYSTNSRGAGGWVSFNTTMRDTPILTTSNISYFNATGLSPKGVNEYGFGSYFAINNDGTAYCFYDFAATAEL